MEKQKLVLNAVMNGITAYLGRFNITNAYVVNGFIDLDLSVKNYLMSVTNTEKMHSSLKMVMFDKDINITISSLSPVDKKKIQLAYVLCKREKYIILDYFEKGLNSKEINYFKKLFKKIKEYQISVIVHTNDVNFIISIVDKICLVKNDNVVKILPKYDLYNNEIYDYVDMPTIIEFINYCKSIGINIDNYLDNKEIIKAIFRMVS